MEILFFFKSTDHTKERLSTLCNNYTESLRKVNRETSIFLVSEEE